MKQENRALTETMDLLETKLADQTEKWEDKLRNLRKKIKILEKDLRNVTEKWDFMCDKNYDLGKYSSILFKT